MGVDHLAKEVFDEQVKNNWPGLVREVKDECEKLRLPNITQKCNKFSESQWKNTVKEACRNKNEEELKERIKKLVKLEEIREESYERKDYLKELRMDEARVKFKIRTRMVDCKMNFSSDPRNKADLWRCDSCQSSVDTQSHILWCPSYSQLREGKSLDSDKDLVTYFSQVMKIRQKLRLNK